MEKILPLTICGVILLIGWVGMEHYKAVRHEFYQVWDTIGEMRGDNVENS